MKGGSAALGTVGAGYSILDWGTSNGAAVAAAPGSNLIRGVSTSPLINGAPARARPETYWTIPFAGTLSQFYVEISAAYGAGQGVDYVIYVNEVAVAALTVNIQGAGVTTGSDLVDSTVVAAGDRVYCHCDRNPGVPGAVTAAAWIRLLAT